MTWLWVSLAGVLALLILRAWIRQLVAADRDFLREDEALIEALHGLKRLYQPGRR